MKQLTITNATKAETVGSRIGLANTFSTRLFGLLGKRRLDAGCGILISPSSGVHTIGMMFPIDVVALDRNMRVLKVWHKLGPFRITSVSLKTHKVLELAPGQIKECKIDVGDQLEIVPCAESHGVTAAD
jgi:uncharacterized membrane protein (UPF0127 family)